jgi:hypothetical protein
VSEWIAGFVSVQANLRNAQVKAGALPAGRNQNEARTRQAIRGIKEMFRKDGLTK